MDILIADDDQVLANLLSARLRKLGYKTVVAFDAMQAVMLAMKVIPAAVLLDLGMPGGTGIEVLRRLRSSNRTSTVPIVVLTGTIESDMGDRVLEMGADAFFKKPLDFEEIEATLRRLIDDSGVKHMGFTAPGTAHGDGQLSRVNATGAPGGSSQKTR
ncbi:MAG: response regulator transcription factor [Candidatus Koribacter versatilis]|uniref:Response regulator transcription factor n=1 Tax=Candidatus Korobacter versatilis TaxID=658062 RepID=A0A932A5V2_9BACT|nr:response regulator transcription factor [Candidatus Koribacter versatilis]